MGGVSLTVPAAKIIANLLLEGVTTESWIRNIQKDNILQCSSVITAKRQANAIRARLLETDEELWRLIAFEDFTTATQATLIATLKKSRLLFDFFRLVILPNTEKGDFALPRYNWKSFLDACKLRDPEMTEWSANTVKRIGSTTFAILKEAGFIENTRKPLLNRILVTPEIENYLTNRNAKELLYLLTWQR